MVTGGPGGAQVGHERLHERIGPVAHFRGEILDAFAGGGGDFLVSAQGERDGHLRHAGGGGEVAHGEPGVGWLGWHGAEGDWRLGLCRALSTGHGSKEGRLANPRVYCGIEFCSSTGSIRFP